MINTAELSEVAKDSLYRDEEVTDDRHVPEGAILVEGIVAKFGFHSQRLESHREQVREWLKQLPHAFRKEEGGGWSFLNAPMLEDGTQWGEQTDAELLLALGTGLGMVKAQLPREMWSALPGGMPYYVIDLNGGASGS